MRRPEWSDDADAEGPDAPDGAESWPAAPAQGPAALGPAAQRTCWRCDKTAVPVDGRCPYCRARLETTVEERIVLPTAEGTDPILKVLCIFGVFVLGSLIQGLIFRAKAHDWYMEDRWEKNLLTSYAIVEAIDTLFVGLAFLWIGCARVFAPPESSTRLVAWLWALPALALLLGVNVGYHWLLNQYVRGVRVGELPFTLLSFALICVQPAVVEELFFRYLTMNALRPYMSVHATVWVAAAMFALAHIGQPVGIPVLILAGATLGYARVLSGGLLLPMILHLLHNTVILYLNASV